MQCEYTGYLTEVFWVIELSNQAHNHGVRSLASETPQGNRDQWRIVPLISLLEQLTPYPSGRVRSMMQLTLLSPPDLLKGLQASHHVVLQSIVSSRTTPPPPCT